MTNITCINICQMLPKVADSEVRAWLRTKWRDEKNISEWMKAVGGGVDSLKLTKTGSIFMEPSASTIVFLSLAKHRWVF